MVTYEQIRRDPEITTYIQAGNDALGVLGFTEHSFAHAGRTAEAAASILTALGDDARTVELARIAAWMHDIGNMINRDNHAMSGAVVAFRILHNLGMPPQELAVVVSAIGNHDENTGRAVNRIAAALILADKSDVRRTRVRNPRPNLSEDIHDRVNYASRHADIHVDTEAKVIILDIDIDTGVCPVMDYFEIFLNRMLMCRRATEYLGLAFRLDINGTQLL